MMATARIPPLLASRTASRRAVGAPLRPFPDCTNICSGPSSSCRRFVVRIACRSFTSDVSQASPSLTVARPIGRWKRIRNASTTVVDCVSFPDRALGGVRVGRDRARTFASSPPRPPGETSDATGTDDPTDPLESSAAPRSAAPSQPLSFVDGLPPNMQPYARLARLDKPIGTMLLLWPCCWSTALAAPPGCLPDPTLLALFAAGSFVMRGAGCTINDMWDADFDGSVARTRGRPLPSGELTHRQALAFLAVQLTAGLGVLLSLPHTAYTFQVGAASLPLVVAYPLMKRYTNWPQLVLGMTFNWGALVGWAAVHGSLDWTVVAPLYGSGIAWTLVYDTLYAHQDKVDDSKLGLKSTAIHFGSSTKLILYGFSTLALTNWILAGSALGYDSPFFYGGCGLAYAHLAWQVQSADLDDPENLAARFKSNNYVGAIIFATFVAGNLTAGL